MNSWFHWRALLPKSLFILTVFVMAAPTHAHVTKIVIDKNKSESPAYNGKSFGSVGQYEKLVGLAYGEIDPNDRRNAVITDIKLAPRNARGMVEYVAVFSIIKPLDMSKASGLMIYDTVNRGNPIVSGIFRSGDENGEAFFENHGAVILSSGWQGDVVDSRGGRAYTIQLPVAKNPDGSSVTGQVLARFVDMPSGTNTLPITASLPFSILTYERPATLDTTQAILTTHASETMTGKIEGDKTIPSTDWAWADCTKTPFPGLPDPTKFCLKNGFDPSLLYQLVFTAKDPVVMGVGLAAIRDINSFFRYADKDDGGNANPVAGKITAAIGHGTSQTGRIVRTFIGLGFNEDESGKIVWDGAHENVGGRFNPVNIRFSEPGGGTGLYDLQSEGASSWGDSPDASRGHKTAGVLDRCRASKTCPKIFETLGSTELWDMKDTPDLVGTSKNKDIPLPENVRRYYFPSTPHFGGTGGFSTATKPAPMFGGGGTCAYPTNPNPESETQRALMLRLIDWVTKGTQPPASSYPTLSNGQLVTPREVAKAFPANAGVQSPADFGTPIFDYDLGPQFDYTDESGIVAKQPPAVKHVIEPLVAKVNADGNETAGIPSVQLQAPLGTYSGWNVLATGFFKGHSCGITGAFIPFAKTKAEQMASGDPRPSLEERYGSQDGYVAAVKAAADKEVMRGFLLPEDAERLVQQASAANIFAK
jgi:hypothetical protein